jgi:hypothetical protein
MVTLATVTKVLGGNEREAITCLVEGHSDSWMFSLSNQHDLFALNSVRLNFLDAPARPTGHEIFRRFWLLAGVLRATLNE